MRVLGIKNRAIYSTAAKLKTKATSQIAEPSVVTEVPKRKVVMATVKKVREIVDAVTPDTEAPAAPKKTKSAKKTTTPVVPEATEENKENNEE